MFTSRTLSTEIKDLVNDGDARSIARVVIATYLLSKMLTTGGLKGDKVRAAFEYADMLLSNNLTEMIAKDREWDMKSEEKK